jgi:hypothetical protein
MASCSSVGTGWSARVSRLPQAATTSLIAVIALHLAGWSVVGSGETLIYSDDFTTANPRWRLTVDMGYVGLSTPQGNLTQPMIDTALANSYANISGGTVNLKANVAAGWDWGVADAHLNLRLPPDFRITFTAAKLQWAGHYLIEFSEAYPASFSAQPPTDAGQVLNWGYAGTWAHSMTTSMYPYTSSTTLAAPIDGTHSENRWYDFEITKSQNAIAVLRDNVLQYQYSGTQSLGVTNYLRFWTHQAGATAQIDSLRIYSTSNGVPEIDPTSAGSVLAFVAGVFSLIERQRPRPPAPQRRSRTAGAA